MLETILGGLMGGIFRVVPEILKFFDAKNERKHELSMQDKAFQFEQLKGNQRIEELSKQSDLEWNKGALDALGSAIKSQGKATGVKWIDGFSSLMRPLITLQWVVLLYPAVIVATFVILILQDVSVIIAINKVFGPEEKTIVSGILNFWFLGRVFDKALKQ